MVVQSLILRCTHNGSKVTNEYINDVLILVSAEEHLESACEAFTNKREIKG